MKKKCILLLILLFITGCSDYYKTDVLEEVVTKEDVINEILSYDLGSDDIDYDFLEYIANNYELDSLIDLKSVLLSDSYTLASWHDITGNSYNVLFDLYNDSYQDKDNIKVVSGVKDNIVINFVGDISLADNWEVMPYYDSRGENVYGILSKDVVDIMNNADIMVANSEFAFSNRGAPLAKKYYTFRANPERVSIYHEMGVDLVTIANNHAYDYGEDAFLDTLNTLDNANIARVGGGRNIEEASRPYYYIINGYKIAFVAATRAEKFILTPEAKEDSSGVMRCYDPALLIDTIKKTKENSDFVILLIHWGKESSHELEDVILETGKKYVDAGADLIVGSHAHVLQGMEYYNDKLIAYNLGNFIFNKKTMDTGILKMNLSYDGELSYEFIPCLQSNAKTTLLYDSDKDRVINFMNDHSINVNVDIDGNILKK